MLVTVLGFVAVTAWVATLVVVTRAVLLRMGPGQVQDEALAAKVAALETVVAGLPSLWEEERSRAERAKERARAHERRAQEILDSLEDDADTGEDVPRRDGGGGEGQGVLPLHPDVGGASQPVPEHVARANAQGLTPWALAGF